MLKGPVPRNGQGLYYFLDVSCNFYEPHLYTPDVSRNFYEPHLYAPDVSRNFYEPLLQS